MLCTYLIVIIHGKRHNTVWRRNNQNPDTINRTWTTFFSFPYNKSLAIMPIQVISFIDLTLSVQEMDGIYWNTWMSQVVAWIGKYLHRLYHARHFRMTVPHSPPLIYHQPSPGSLDRKHSQLLTYNLLYDPNPDDCTTQAPMPMRRSTTYSAHIICVSWKFRRGCGLT